MYLSVCLHVCLSMDLFIYWVKVMEVSNNIDWSETFIQDFWSLSLSEKEYVKEAE